MGGGILLGSLAVGSGLHSQSEREASYAALSANPNAAAADGIAAQDCLDCPGSYGAAVRLRAIHEVRIDESFRKLGEVETDYPPIHEPADDYVYGGRFPDPEPEMASRQGPVAAAPGSENPVILPDGGVQLMAEAPLPAVRE
ncbi:hypothetical protein [Sphingopyxis macrogoltabida]|uniref:Uncharacterized protein n=1 Tax=Sphingopyxis macrogoltabida TaxID=33050 RepID=A0AAC8YZU5_SPHMC|nr:hypothetical protein [Sphingopyxis macrogoltabida]ALJ13261.1 hypothetical protein LH19_10315 [Sphingopyxis macrogoltabida]AMU89275.1 hypothetical protein ATM17_09520 [Sphingopyxis macrogoltabida]